MAGHSKWANIKHRKAAVDKKRAKIWSKISRAIIVASRAGGPDPAMNLSLRYAIDEAKAANMPKDTIKRAVDKGSGSKEGGDFEEITYEGYGQGGSAIIVTALTDNRTRTAGDVRTIFNKNGGSIGNPGSVAYMFQTQGQIYIEASKADEETLMELALEAGAEDVQAPDEADGDEGVYLVVCDPTQFLAVKEAIEAASIEIADSEITKVPDSTVAVPDDEATKLLKLIDLLEDLDDVQKVYHNAEVSDEVLAAS